MLGAPLEVRVLKRGILQLQRRWLGRPAHPRNCFELLSAAMTILKRRMGNRTRIVAAGSEWDPHHYGLDGIVENLGNLDYRDTGIPLQNLLPLELMACATLVVSTRKSTDCLVFERSSELPCRPE